MIRETKKLLRFEKATEKRIDTLSRESLYFSSASSFNDLFDVIVNKNQFEHQVFDMESLKLALEKLYLNFNRCDWPLNSQVLGCVSDWLNASEKYDDLDLGKGRVLSLRQKSSIEEDLISSISTVFEEAPICCFFESKIEDPLLWAHYAQNHSGFCVEYELQTGIYNSYNISRGYEVLPVVYSTVKKPLEPLQFLLNPYQEAIHALSTKSVNWSHENEVRIVNTAGTIGNDLIPDGVSISKIYLGHRFSMINKEFLESILAVADKLKVELYVMAKNNTTMELEPTPWSKAKVILGL